MLHTGLTGGVGWSDRSGLSYCSCPVSSGVLHAFVQVELHWFRGSLHVCRGSSLWFFELWFGGLCSLLEHSFVSDVSSRCPCLRGPRPFFFKWSCSLLLLGFRSLVGVSFYSFLFFLLSLVLLFVGVVKQKKAIHMLQRSSHTQSSQTTGSSREGKKGSTTPAKEQRSTKLTSSP
jgi:hypothetical protein